MMYASVCDGLWTSECFVLLLAWLCAVAFRLCLDSHFYGFPVRPRLRRRAGIGGMDACDVRGYCFWKAFRPDPWSARNASFQVLLDQSAAVDQFHDLPVLTHAADTSHSSNRRCWLIDLDFVAQICSHRWLSLESWRLWSWAHQDGPYALLGGMDVAYNPLDTTLRWRPNRSSGCHYFFTLMTVRDGI